MKIISNYLLSENFIKKIIELNYRNIKIQKITLLKRGIYSDIYQIITFNNNIYIFKIYREHFKRKEQLEFEIKLVNLLQTKNFYVTEYIKTNLNDFYIVIDLFGMYRYAILMNYKIGEELNFNIKEDIILYANSVASFHKITKDVMIDCKYLNHKNSILNRNVLMNMKNSVINFLDDTKYIEKFQKIFDFILDYRDNIKNLSKQIIHGDLHGGNCLKINKKLLFMDFDFSNYDYLLIDISTYHWSCIIRHKEKEWDIFIKEYMKKSVFLKQELKYLEFFVIIRELHIFYYYIKATKFMGKNLINDKIIENKIKFINYIKRRIE